jgi:hypothetical protein
VIGPLDCACPIRSRRGKKDPGAERGAWGGAIRISIHRVDYLMLEDKLREVKIDKSQ